MRKRIVALVLFCTIIFCCFLDTGTAFAWKGKSKGDSGERQNHVLFAEKITVNGKMLSEPENVFDRPEVTNNLLGRLGSETDVSETLSLGKRDIKINRETYVKDSVSLSGTDIIISKPLVAKNDISISATNVAIENAAFLLSVEGNISIYCTNLSVKGTVCAKKKVFFTGSKAIVNEAVFAERIEFYTGDYQSDDSVNKDLFSARKDLLAGLSVYEEDGTNYLYVSGNVEFSTMDIYGRKTGEDSFALVQKNVMGEKEIPNHSEYSDYAAVMHNSFGFTFKTDPVSISEEEGTLYCAYGTDSDDDGVTDAYEIWLSGTDPCTPDCFPNQDFYVYLSGYEGTICYDRLLRRDVSYATTDYTKSYGYDDGGRVSETVVQYRDGTEKRIRYEYENDRVKNLYVGANKYTVTEDDTAVRYYVNGALIKQEIKSGNVSTIDYFDGTKEVYIYDDEDNLVSYRNMNLYEMTYNQLYLMTGLSKNGISYGKYNYDEYGDYVTIDTTDYTIRYTYDYPLYQADYSFGDVRKTHKVNCRDDAYTRGDIVLLTDGTTGTAIPKDVVGEILSSDASNRILRYRIGTETHTVWFNARGYVIKDSVTDGTAESTNVYSYDAYGNLRQTETAKDGQKVTHSYGYSTTWTDELTSYGGNNIAYDTFGKPVRYYNGASFTWAGGKLSAIKTEECQAFYSYDYTGLREEKTVNGTIIKYVYEGGDLIAELSDDSLFFTYDGNFSLVGFVRNGEAFYYQYDLFGDVIGIVNGAGETLCTYSYNLWGELLSITGDEELAHRNPIRYRGYYYDNESGFYYLETRYYDPHVKRFISYDDLESFFYGEEEDIESLFSYCGNNPVMYLDYDGQMSFCNVIFNTEFVDAANSYKAELDYFLWNKYGSGTYTSTIRTEIVSKEQFKAVWKALSGHIKFFVYAAHGGYRTCGKVTIDDIVNLPILDVEYMFLLACNCGHYDYADRNIAKVFSHRITGSVVASDGNVFVRYLKQSNRTELRVNAGEEYMNLLKNGERPPRGWIVYKKYTTPRVLGLVRAWYRLSDILKKLGM